MDPNGIASHNRNRVDHTYRDFSCYLDEGGDVVRHKKAGANFPAKLHQMLSDEQCSHIITWMPHGRAWKIINKELLMSDAVPKYLAQTKFESFTRQLSGWGFKRLCRPGPDHGCYYHECFLRGIPLLTWVMRRVKAKQGKPLPNPEGEPDFFYISSMHPLPPSPYGVSPSRATSVSANESIRYSGSMTYRLMPDMQSNAQSMRSQCDAQNLMVSCAQKNSSAISMAMPMTSYSGVAHYSTLTMPNTQDSSSATAHASSDPERIVDAPRNEASAVDHYPPPYQTQDKTQASVYLQERPTSHPNYHNPMYASYPACSYPPIHGNSQYHYDSRLNDYSSQGNYKMDPERIAAGAPRSQAQDAQYSNPGSSDRKGFDDHSKLTVQAIAASDSLRKEESSGQEQGTEHSCGGEGDIEFDNRLNAFMSSFGF